MSTRDSSGPRRTRRRVELLPALVVLVVVATASALGAWQLSRAEHKRTLAAQRDAANAAVAIALDAGVALDAALADPAGLDARRVLARGRYSVEHTVYIDNRTLRGVAGFHVVTPLRIEGSPLAVLVLRGWIAGDPRERSRLPQVRTPRDTVAVEGIAQASIEQSLELGATAHPGVERLWQNLDFARFERWSGLALVPLLIRESAEPSAREPAQRAVASSEPREARAGEGDGLVREWPIGGPDASRHTGYAMQWFALALAAAGAWLYFALGRSRDPSA